MTNGFALNHDKNLHIYFCVKRQAKTDFLKDVESTEVSRFLKRIKNVFFFLSYP